jgi:hypothetical protein
MHKVMNETTLRMRGLISRRMFSQAGIAALSAKLLPRITFGFAAADAAAPSSAHGLPTQAAVYGGVYAQAREFYGPKRRDRDAPVRIAQRQGCMRECTGGGAFAETEVCTLFGYLPKFGGTPELLNADTPRGFTGELRHVCCGAQRYTIQSSRNWADAGN